MMRVLLVHKFSSIMQKIRKTFYRFYFYLLAVGSIFLLPYQAVSSSNPYNDQGIDLKNKKLVDFKAEKVKTVQLEADKVQFIQENNEAIASGNVVVKADKTTLYADQLQLEKAIGDAVASGHVYIDAPDMQVDADQVHYNFNQGTGKFENARIFNGPFQIKGETVSKVSENHMVMENGFLTTCDFDEPHFRMATHRMDVYQGDKAVARGVKLYLGKVPLMYFPRFEQNLKDRPIFTMTPGYKKDFGAFLLTQLRLKLSDHVKLTLYGDLYERTGIGEGADLKYDTPHFGSGILRTYYIYENQIASKHLWDMNTSDGTKKGPTIRHELYRVEWRHKWNIDRNTSAVWQYYKVHDWDLANYGFIKKYFEREFRRGPDVTTYFLLTKNLPVGTLTYRIEASRVNPALRTVERLPEVQYQLSGQKLGETNFYLKSTDTYSNLVNRPGDVGPTMKTQRLDLNNEISYPKKIAFIETRPWVGGEHTYYSRTIDPNQSSVIRGQFKTGIDLTTHFYRIWNYRAKILGSEINGLRHVVTPSVTYGYAHRPTLSASRFNQFDTIDALAQSHHVLLSLENKIQTKRNNRSVDLIRTIVETDYNLIKSEPGRSFGPVISTIEFNPNNWLTFKADESYDNKNKRWNYANFDAYINGGDKWSFGIGKRFAHHMDDELTTQWIYKINPKWKFKLDDRFILDKGIIQQEDYILTRDLHEWEMDIDYHQERGNGTAFLITFRLKAFPNMIASSFSDSYHQPKAGSQSTTAASY
jgi:LPS-assembly protein